MTRSEVKSDDRRGSLLFVLLALGLVAAILVFRTLPANRHLNDKKLQRKHWQQTHRKTRQELQQLDALSATIGVDLQTTERYLRRQNFARKGETTIVQEEPKH